MSETRAITQLLDDGIRVHKALIEHGPSEYVSGALTALENVRAWVGDSKYLEREHTLRIVRDALTEESFHGDDYAKVDIEEFMEKLSRRLSTEVKT